MKRNLLRFSFLSAFAALCGGLAVSAMLGEESKIPSAELKAATVEKTATWDFLDASIMAETVALSHTSEPGNVKAKENNGILLNVFANNKTLRDNGNSLAIEKGVEFRVPVVTAEDLVTINGYPDYSHYFINGGDEITNNSANPSTVYKARNSDVQRGYVSIVSGENNYFYSISVQQMKPRQLLVLDNEAVNATFKFDLGTEKQTATFNEPDYFVSSKVTYGANLVLDGQDNKGHGQTWFTTKSKQSGPKDDNFIRFTIQPRFGLSFTPTKVSFKSTRFGTGGGHMDIAWLNPDGSTVVLAKDQNPPRENENPSIKEYSYTVTGAKPAEGACGILINLYSLDPSKHVGYSDIVIEGTLSGNEKEVPVLESFSANGVDYLVEEIFEADGGNYEATIEIASAETMISESNPVKNVEAASGVVGTVVYEGDDNKCNVTIPVSLNGVTINYIAHFVRKPLYTLTYIDTTGETMGTQKVEKDAKIGAFAVDYTKAKTDEGYKVRGWFEQPTSGKKKFSVNDVVTGNMTLYAFATEIEVVSPSRKYIFDLTSDTFYPEDHDAFNPDGGYWHDKTHGWAFKPGTKIGLLVGPKASISIGLCKYGYATGIVVKDADGNTLETLAGMSADTDGEIVAYNYEGTGGEISLNLEGTGEMFIHSVKIVNTSEVAYDKQGQWYHVKAGDAQSFLDVLEAVNAANGNREAERSFIYVPNGLYDLRDKVLTQISGHNISIIGQSQEGVVIKNAPSHLIEGISTTATLMNVGTNLYFQDITIQNALDYYGALGNKQPGGRAVALWDKGTNTVCKNVTLLSYQDTYYSNNGNGYYYWETSEVHGTVDFFCGGGTMFMENSKIVVEKRNLNGSGGCTIAAPYTEPGKKYGYVFNNCYIENYAQEYNLGRAWGGAPRCAYLNTTLSDNKLVSSRWTAGGMNVAAKEFVEYNTMDKDGNVVSPSSKVINFTHTSGNNRIETILSAAQAAEFTVEKVFPDWNPAELAAQVAAPVAQFANGEITWAAVDGAIAYAIFNNNELVAITPDTAYAVANAADTDNYSIRAVNKMGGMGVAAPVNGLTTGIDEIEVSDADIVGTDYYNLQGIKVDAACTGVLIKVVTLSDGRTVTSKVINR